MHVISYINTAVGETKHNLIKCFYEGVKTNNDCLSELSFDTKWKKSDIGFMLGFYGTNVPTQSQSLRKEIFENQTRVGKYCSFVDSDVLNSASNNKWTHYRIPFKSVFPNQAVFYNENSPSDRWELLSKRKEIKLKPWRKNGEHILIMAQRGIGGWTMKGLDRENWINQTIKEIRKHSDRPILIRQHPGDPLTKLDTITDSNNKTYFSDATQRDLLKDLDNAWASVTFSSSASVASIISGIPLFVLDDNAITYNVSNYDLSEIENPVFKKREQWLYDLSYAHWNLDELKDGLYWKHFWNNYNK